MADAENLLRALRDAAPQGYLVGGAVRDELLGRPTDDFDVVVVGDARPLARSLARTLDAHAFELSGSFGAWRVVEREHRWQLDVLPVHDEGIEADLAQRDLTINAIARRLGDDELLDPFAGRDDLAARRLRMVSAGAFAADPLRTLRLVRLACELGFEAEAETLAAARAAAGALPGVSAERVFAELKRVVASERVLAGMALLAEVGAEAVVLPELSALRGVVQSPYHHLDVHAHTLAVLGAVTELERDPGRWFPEQTAEVARHLGEPLANELTRGQALRFGALLHDIAKPQTRAVSGEGRVSFMGHDERGAELAASILTRLRASQRLIDHVAALARHHLRLGFLVHEVPLPPRTVYRYLRTCEPVEVDVTLLSVADRLATRGRGAEVAIERHLALARELLAAALRWREQRPRPPVRGDELVRELGVAPGPSLGALLQELEAASYAGEIASREQALERARQLVQGGALADR